MKLLHLVPGHITQGSQYRPQKKKKMFLVHHNSHYSVCQVLVLPVWACVCVNGGVQCLRWCLQGNLFVL